MLAAARLMNQGSGHLFAGAALTRDQHGAVAGADDAKESNTARIRALRPTTMESVAGKGEAWHPQRTRRVSNSGIASRSAISNPR